MCGVLMIGFPMQPSASNRWSSVRMKMTFGRLAARGAAAGAATV